MGKAIADPSLLQLSTGRLKKLRSVLEKDKKRLRYLTNKGKVTKPKRAAARQSGEGIGILLGVLAPVLINLAKDLITKYVANKKKK